MSGNNLTQEQLAKALDVSSRTIMRWEKEAEYPHRNATPENVKAWRASRVPKLKGDLDTLKCEKLQQEIDINELRMAKLRREQMSIAAVDSLSRLIGQKLSLLVRQKVEVELPGRCVGKSIAELNVECAAVADEIREIVNANLADYGKLNADE